MQGKSTKTVKYQLQDRAYSEISAFGHGAKYAFGFYFFPLS
jgi:hypothetical protein